MPEEPVLPEGPSHKPVRASFAPRFYDAGMRNEEMRHGRHHSGRRGHKALSYLSVMLVLLAMITVTNAGPLAQEAVGWTPPASSPYEWAQVPFTIEKYTGTDESATEKSCFVFYFVVLNKSDANSMSGPFVDGYKFTTLYSYDDSASWPLVKDMVDTYTYDNGIKSHTWNFGSPSTGLDDPDGPLGALVYSVGSKGDPRPGASGIDINSYCDDLFGEIIPEMDQRLGSQLRLWQATDPAGDNALPHASFTSSAAPSNPLEVQFTSTSTHPTYATEQLTHMWDFGDGTTAVGIDPVHTYAKAGRYKVTLTVRTPMWRQDTFQNDVTVGDGLIGALFNPATNGSHRVRVGEDLDLRLRVENLSKTNLTNVKVTSIEANPTAPIDPTNPAAATVKPLPGGMTLSGTLADQGPAAMDFAEYRVTGTTAGTMQVVANVEGTKPDGTVITTQLTFDLEVSPSDLQATVKVVYPRPANPGPDTPPPSFDVDNNGDGTVDELDKRIQIEVTVANTSDVDIKGVAPLDPSKPITFTADTAGGGAVGLIPNGTLPGVLGDFQAHSEKTFTYAYDAIEPFVGKAQILLHGMMQTDPVKAVSVIGSERVEFGTDLALEIGMSMEARPYSSGQVVRLQGTLRNLLKDQRLPNGALDKADNLIVILEPINEDNSGNGFFVPESGSSQTPTGPDPIVVKPGETVNIHAILVTTRQEGPTTAAVQYLANVYQTDAQNPDLLAQKVDQTRVVTADDTHSDLAFQTDLAPVNLQPDKLQACESELLGEIVSCNLITGFIDFGKGMAGMVELLANGTGEFLRGGFYTANWAMHMLNRATLALLQNPEAIAELKQEIQVQMQTFAELKLVGEDALIGVGDAVVKTLAEVEQVLRSGDTKTIAGWLAYALGSNPDLGIAALTKAKTVRSLVGILDKAASQSKASKIILEGAEKEIAQDAANLESRVTESRARGNDPATDGTFRGGEVVTKMPSVFRGVYGARATEIKKLLEIAKSEDILIAIRSRSPKSAALLDKGLAYVKPMDVETKNVNEIDVNYLGFRREALGTVEIMEPPFDYTLGAKGREAELNVAIDGYMEKLKTAHPEIAADPVWEREVRDRLELRSKEFYKEMPNFRRYRTQGINVEFGYAEQGLPAELDDHVADMRKAKVGMLAKTDIHNGSRRRIMTLKMADASGSNFKVITGDIDVVSILNADRTVIVDVSKRIRIYHQLREVIGMMHGESHSWINVEGQIKMLRDHIAGKAGSESLLVAGSDGQLRTGYFEELLSSPDPGSGLPPQTTFNLVSGAPAKLVTVPTAGSAANLVKYWDAIDAITKKGPFYAPGAIAKFLAMMSGEETPSEFNPQGPIIRPDGKGGAKVYEPAGVPQKMRATKAKAALGDDLDALADEVEAAEPDVYNPANTPGAEGGLWRSITPQEAVALGKPGVLDQAPLTALRAQAPAGSRTLDIVDLPGLAMSPTSRYFKVGDTVVVDPGGSGEQRAKVTDVSPLTLNRPLHAAQSMGTLLVVVQAATTENSGPTTLPHGGGATTPGDSQGHSGVPSAQANDTTKNNGVVAGALPTTGAPIAPLTLVALLMLGMGLMVTSYRRYRMRRV